MGNGYSFSIQVRLPEEPAQIVRCNATSTSGTSTVESYSINGKVVTVRGNCTQSGVKVIASVAYTVSEYNTIQQKRATAED